MQITYEVELDLGDVDEGTPSPTASDVETALVKGLADAGLTIAGATAQEL